MVSRGRTFPFHHALGASGATVKHFLLSFALVLWVVAPSPAWGAYHHAAHGYSLVVPDDWIQVPPEVVEQVTSMLMTKDAQAAAIVAYDAVFQPRSNPNWLAYPYVMVQPLNYAKLGVGRQINEDEFAQVIRQMTGQGLEQGIEKNVNAEFRSLLSNPQVKPPQLDVASRRFTWEIAMDVVGVGPVRGRLMGYFGKEALIQVAFYAQADQWDRHAAAGDAILNSFAFDPDKAYSEDLAAQSPSVWSNVVRNGLIGGVVGVVGALWSVRQSRKRKATRERGASPTTSA
jgi:uncharacterized membrane-anchored protein